jgi:hypothetical protein
MKGIVCKIIKGILLGSLAGMFGKITQGSVKSNIYSSRVKLHIYVVVKNIP